MTFWARGHGGARRGAGRKPGIGNEKLPFKRQTDIVRKIKAESRAFPVIVEFEGDAIDFMEAIYRNAELPLGVRMEAARVAAPYQRTRRTATEITGKDGGPGLLEQIAEAALAAVLAEREREKEQGEHVVH